MHCRDMILKDIVLADAEGAGNNQPQLQQWNRI